ncbi:hypothetical protein OAF25_02875, partial [Akkermansiaceae bacterium]|nr:hypothetical protein [Akkermansiaceae bacterium]
HFTPHTWGAPYSFYQFQMASWPAWHEAWKKGKLSGVHETLWENNQPTEELYDTQIDPWEIKNLATDPTHAERLSSMRGKLVAHMLMIRDTGLVPEPLFDIVRGDKTIMETAAGTSQDACEKLLNLAFIASSGDPDGQQGLEEATTHKNPIARFWAYSGLVTLGEKAASSEKVIIAGLKDEIPLIRAQAAIALHNIGHKQSAVQALVKELDANLSITNEAMIINTLMQIRETKAIPKSWYDRNLSKEKNWSKLRLGTLAENVSMFHTAKKK